MEAINSSKSLKQMVTKFDNDLLGFFFLNCNGCSISCVIKASAKSQMLLVQKYQSTSYIYSSSFSIIFLLWILHVLPCKLYFFFPLSWIWKDFVMVHRKCHWRFSRLVFVWKISDAFIQSNLCQPFHPFDLTHSITMSFAVLHTFFFKKKSH